MAIFVTGASGYIGGAIATALAESGQSVRGLVRTEEKARRLAAAGIVPVLGTLDDAETLAREARAADAVVNAADSDHLGAAEANKLKIPVVAIADTNCDPDVVDYVIPGNDDAIRAIRLVSTKIADAVNEGRQEFIARAAEKVAIAEEAAAIKAEERGEPAVFRAAPPEDDFIDVIDDEEPVVTE